MHAFARIFDCFTRCRWRDRDVIWVAPPDVPSSWLRPRRRRRRPQCRAGARSPSTVPWSRDPSEAARKRGAGRGRARAPKAAIRPRRARVAQPQQASGAPALGFGQAHRELLGDARRNRARDHQAHRRDRARPTLGGHVPHQPPPHGRRRRAASESALAARQGLRYPSLFVVSTSRGKIAAGLELDVVVDDRPENCLDIAIDSKARAILIWRGDQNAVPASARRLGIGGVNSVAACLDLLVAADNPDAGQTSVVDRLKRLLGLKRSTSGAA